MIEKIILGKKNFSILKYYEYHIKAIYNTILNNLKHKIYIYLI